MPEWIQSVIPALAWLGSVAAALVVAYCSHRLAFRFGRRTAASERLLNSYADLIQAATGELEAAKKQLALVYWSPEEDTAEDEKRQQEVCEVHAKLASAQGELLHLRCRVFCLERDVELRNAIDKLREIQRERPIAYGRGMPKNREECESWIDSFSTQVDHICSLVRKRYAG